MEVAEDAFRYVLMTAAHNEETLIENTIRSVLSQTILPRKWVIVSDGSTDRTNEIIDRYAKQYDLIAFLRLERTPGRSFGSKVRALQRGARLLEGINYSFIGNIDADVVIESSYFENLMQEFGRRSELGLLAGFVYEEQAGRFRRRSSNRVDSVPHCAQLLRRQCYEEIGGYAVLRYGGEDWYAQTCARMKGWHAQALPALPVYHYRRTGAGSNVLRDRFRAGKLDYSFGSDPVFEVFKCALRITEAPFVLGALTRYAGFVWSYVTEDERPVSNEFIAFLRGEQKTKMLSMFRNGERRGVVGT